MISILGLVVITVSCIAGLIQLAIELRADKKFYASLRG